MYIPAGSQPPALDLHSFLCLVFDLIFGAAQLCGFKASGDFGSSGSMFEDRLRSAAMELALRDVASITNSVASQ